MNIAGTFSSPLPAGIEHLQAVGGKSAGEGLKHSAAQQVGEDFEAVFMSMLLKQLRSSMSEDGLFSGDKSDTYGGIFDLFLGKHVAAASPLGVGQMVQSYLESTGASES
jgi:flagellar protein FlgJ